MIVIDGVTYNVPVVALRRRGEFLDKYAERTEDGVLHRELIGVYFNYELEFGAGGAPVDYAALWLKLTEPVEFHSVTVPDENGVSYTYTAYVSNVSDELRRVRAGQPFWKSLTANFIAQSPARVP